MKQLLIIITLMSALLTPFLSMQLVSAAAVDILNNGTGPCNNSDSGQSPATTSPATGNSGTPSICGDNNVNGPNPLFGPSGIVTVIVKILSYVVGFLALIFMVVQAIKITSSGGDPQTVSSGRAGILYALIGLVVAVLAQVLVAFVLNKVQ